MMNDINIIQFLNMKSNNHLEKLKEDMKLSKFIDTTEIDMFI